MDLPVIKTPIFPRSLWMEEVTYSHIPIATIITAFMFLAPIFETIGMRRKDLRYDRLAKSLVYFSMILFSPGAALGTGIPMFIIGLYPEFWARWANLFFWPLILQFLFFTIEVVFLFFFYYLPWDRMMNRKRLHIFYGCLAALFGLLIQAVWDMVGAYMSTPSVALPAVNQPVAWSLGALLNPSFPYLFIHRFFGNISYTMMLAGGVYALHFLLKKDEKEKQYYGWASDLTFTLGFLTFFVMPFIGWGYARIFQRESPVIFHAIMGGHAMVYFVIKLSLIVTFLTIGGIYVFVRHRQKLFMLVIVTIVLASFYILLHYHPPLTWLPGGAIVWRSFYTVLLLGFITFMWLMRWKGKEITIRFWPFAIFVAGMAAFFTFALGGYVRERSRNPYSVYEELHKPEAKQLELDRFLVYDNCVECHHMNPKFLKQYEARDWELRVEIERARPGVVMSDEETKRIIRWLEEKYPDAR
jgi:cytochrome bd-type quinol oxidase subunit 1